MALALALCLLNGCGGRREDAFDMDKAGEVLGEKGSALTQTACPEGYWVYDGALFEQEAEPGEADYAPYLLVRRCSEVYGYELLDGPSQQMFDLCYGEYFSQQIRDDGIPSEDKIYPFHHFTAPEPLTPTQWNNVSILYEAATISYSYRPFRYLCGDDTVGKVNCLGEDCWCLDPAYQYHFTVGGSIFSDRELNDAFDRLQAKAEEILSGMGTGLTQAEICEYLARYLTDHVTYYTDLYWERRIVGDITIVNSDAPFITAYGALLEGQANCFGYARAFDYLAKKAGLTSIVVLAYNENDPIGHAWNMVQVDGAWYQLDAAWMDTQTPEPDLRWFLFEAGEPEHAYYNRQFYSRTDIPLPQCAAKPYRT